jgi:Asp-tRNA(Asn)/Glu-tRNA(Gln) amidotransferase A subunit family amidase
MGDKNEVYDLESVDLPYLSGTTFRLFVSLLESPLRDILAPNLMDNIGITDFREAKHHEPPTLYPYAYNGQLSVEDSQVPRHEYPQKPTDTTKGFRFATTHDYAQAYQEREIDPVEVAEKVLQAIKTSDEGDQPLRAFITVDDDDVMVQARASKERHLKGEPLSVFDGVPVAIKDVVDMVPYPTTAGTAFLGSEPATGDSTVVARMRAAGALLIGKANMHEIGSGMTGFNRHHGLVRNPYNPDYYSGGSSSGSAASVASGLCPAAIGGDEGGSIRVPASFCGLVGLKATFGRVSEYGAVDLAWSVAHLGPIAATATDAALMYGIIAGPDRKDSHSWHQLAPTLKGWEQMELDDYKFGIFWPWFKHASPEVVNACETMVREFENRGAQIQEVKIPDLEAGRVAHLIMVTGEMAQALDRFDREHRTDYSLEVRTNLALARELTGRDYIQAQRVRTRLINSFNAVLEEVDAILTPTSGITTPAIPETALPDGDSDLITLTEIMRFAPPANMTGLPAISFPVGYSDGGLPIGLQAIGRAWNEQKLLSLAHIAEGIVERQKPQVWFEIL